MTAFTQRPINIVDAFTRSPFSGNPAAIVILSKHNEFSDETYQKIASEMNLSETAFVAPLDRQGPNPVWSLRWFSPTNEVNFCGHATLATSHVLFSILSNSGSDSTKPLAIQFESAYGELTVERSSSGLYRMKFPKGQPEPVDMEPKTLTRILELLSLNEHDDKVNEVVLCKKTRKLMICFEKLDSVLRASPHTNDLLEFNFHGNEELIQNVKGIIANTQFKSDYQNELRLDTDDYEFVSRYFTPWNGIPEDPVNGSGHTVQAVYWGSKLNKTSLKAFQASKRRGELFMELNDDESMFLCGYAVTVLVGQINVPLEK